ncbi:MAG: methyl-accepting chemotaxis protein [Lachnospiraceae bacterium]|nr:methyl-accepting chemotaxis protein [Lachnospiraceae bacterium]
MTQKLKDLSIRYKILIPVGLLGILMFVMGIMSLWSTAEIMSTSRDISDNYAMKIEKLGETNSSYQTLRRVAFAHIIADTKELRQNLEDEAASLKATISAACDEYEKLVDSDEARESLEQFKSSYTDYLVIYDAILKYSAEGDKESATALANNDLKQAGTALTAVLNTMTEMNEADMEKAVVRQDDVYKSVRLSILIIFIAGMLVLVFVVWVSWKWCVKRLININKQLRDVIASIDAGEGDLTKRVQCFCTDEIGTLASGINSFIETLQGIMGQINSSSGQLGSIVKLVSDKVSMANNNSNDISSVMEELSTAMKGISASLTSIKDNAGNVDENIIELSDESQGLYDYAVDMKKRAEDLEKNAVANKQSTSDVVNDIIGQLKQAIERSKSVDRVNDLTDEILSISSQTNLLSLNASIEAARAGEAGRGFAVVAGEISQLAESSREAANNIQTINNMVVEAVNELIKSANSLVDYINETIVLDYEGFVNAGKQYNDDAVHVNEIVTRFNDMSINLKQSMESIMESINGINMSVDESTTSTTNVAANTSDLVKGIGEIANAMDDNKQVAGALTEEADRFVKF